MRNPYTRQALTEDIKKEVLMELNLGNFQGQSLVDSVKRDVLLELSHYNNRQPFYPNRDFMESVKNEVLAGVHKDMGLSLNPYYNRQYPDRATIESVKQEVLAQMKMEQKNQEESSEQEQGNINAKDQRSGTVDPFLVQAVKNSVIAEMNTPHYR